MPIKRFLLVFAACIIAIGILYAFSIQRSAGAELIGNAVDDYLDIQSLLLAEKIEFDKVGKLYDKSMKKIVYEVDKKDHRHIGDEIDSALEIGPEADIPKAVGQVIDKSLLHTFFQYIQLQSKELATAKDVEKEKIIQRIRIAAKSFAPTIEKREGMLKDGGVLAAKFQSQLDGLDTGGAQSAKELIHSLKTVIILSVIYNVEAVEHYRERDRFLGIEKMAEAKMFYNMIYEDHAKKNREEAILTLGEFSKTLTEFDGDFLREELGKSFKDFAPEIRPEMFAPAEKAVPENLIEGGDQA